MPDAPLISGMVCVQRNELSWAVYRFSVDFGIDANGNCLEHGDTGSKLCQEILKGHLIIHRDALPLVERKGSNPAGLLPHAPTQGRVRKVCRIVARFGRDAKGSYARMPPDLL